MMFDGAKNANQRNMVYTAGLNAGVSGLTPGMHDSIKNEALQEEQGKELLNKYYSSNEADKISMYPELRSHLIKSGNQTDRALLNSLEQDNKIRKSSQGNQQVAELIVSQYPDVFTPATKSFIEGASTLSPEAVKTFGTMVSSHIEGTTKNYTAGMKAAMELINREEPGIDATDEDRLRHRALIQMGLSMKAELEGRGRTEDEETRTVPYPKLGILDEDITGKDNTFDAMSDERKSSEFKRTLEQVIPGGEEAWKNMDRDTKAEKGQEIIKIINQFTPGQAGTHDGTATGTPLINAFFTKSPSETWNPRTGAWTFDVSWTYEPYETYQFMALGTPQTKPAAPYPKTFI